jgi:hypothetical protein
VTCTYMINFCSIHFYLQLRISRLVLLVLTAPCLSSAAIDASFMPKVQELIQVGDLTSANPALLSVLKSDPRNGGLYNLRGIIDAQSGHPNDLKNDDMEAILPNIQIVGRSEF